MLHSFTKIRSFLGAATLALAAGSALAQTATFSESNRQLTLPSVQVGNVLFSNVVVRLDAFTVLASGPGTPISLGACTEANFTTARYNAIAIGMTPDQVNDTMGCVFTPALTQRGPGYVALAWSPASTRGLVVVFFDANGSVVTPLAGSTSFKSSSGF